MSVRRRLTAVTACIGLLAAALPRPAWTVEVVHIACLGDSNTAAGWPTTDAQRWCEYAATLCPLVKLDDRPPRAAVFHNFGIGGAVITEPYIGVELRQAVDAGADVVVLAFATRDRRFETPAQYAANVVAACERARRPCYVMTMPPHTVTDYDGYNAAVARVIPASRLIDRTTQMTFVDGVHLSDASERLLATRAARAFGCYDAGVSTSSSPITHSPPQNARSAFDRRTQRARRDGNRASHQRTVSGAS